MTFASSLIVCAARAFKLRVPIIIFAFIAATYKENLERYSIFANMATAVLTCPLCESLSLTLKAYISHLRLVHAKDSSFRVMCGINGCREIFRAFSAFNSHVYRHHRTALGLGSDETVDQQSGSGSTHEANSAAHSTDYDTLLTTGGSTTAGQLNRTKEGDGGDDNMQLSSYRSPSTDSDLCAPYAAKFLLQLREGRQISQVAVSDVIDGCKALCKKTADKMKNTFQLSLAAADIALEDVPGMTDIFAQDPDPFRGVETNYLYEKFCIEHLGCVVSACEHSPILHCDT